MGNQTKPRKFILGRIKNEVNSIKTVRTIIAHLFL